ncbi:signal peptidase I [Ornithinibacillus sp. 179-J 7C1 HS]|uniref:signal peptidase I n=1 Tax=Ornithinibacillus sp. 179-J 7C1 HS TaxID=3142384 RepID=UPI0039A3E8EE
MVTSVTIENTNKVSEKSKTSWLGGVGFIVILLLAFFIFRFAVGFIVISGDSMNPTLEDSNVVFSSNIFYSVDRNDIVVFRDGHGFDVIKRVIGLPNDRVAIQDGHIFVNGDMISEAYSSGIPNDMEEIIVPGDSYFVVGDNRTPGESLDSRSSDVGPIHSSNIHGEVMFSLFPLSFQLTK